MTLPDIDSGGTYGGYPGDYSPAQDPTKERPAAAVNKAYSSTVGMTQTATRAWARFQTQGTGVPLLSEHGATWGNSASVAPTPARTGFGIYTMTWPTPVFDDIPPGAPGYLASGHNLNLRTGWGNAEGGGFLFHINCIVTAPNVVTIYIHDGSGALNDPASTTFGVFVR